MDSVEKRIEKAIELSGCKTRKLFSELIGVTPDALKKWENRETGITPAGIMKITDKISISRTYLETGTGDAELTNLGVSNYSHDDREKDIITFFRKMKMEDKKNFYKLMKLVVDDTESANLDF